MPRREVCDLLHTWEGSRPELAHSRRTLSVRFRIVADFGEASVRWCNHAIVLSRLAIRFWARALTLALAPARVRRPRGEFDLGRETIALERASGSPCACRRP